MGPEAAARESATAEAAPSCRLSATALPESVSRFNRFRSAPISTRADSASCGPSQELVNDSFEINRDLHIQPHRSGWRLVQYRVKDVARSFPRKRTNPVAISYSTAPKENRSVRASSSLPRTCSGDMGAEAVLHSLSDSAPAKPRSIGRLGTTACLHNSAWA